MLRGKKDKKLVGSPRQNITRAIDYMKDLIRRDMKKKKIIFIEGADKSGKSSVVRYLGSKGYHIINEYPSFPDFKHNKDFFEDHADNIELAVEMEGNIVIDRSVMTTLVNLEVDGNQPLEYLEEQAIYLIRYIHAEKKLDFRPITIVIDSEQRIEDEHISRERREKLRAVYNKFTGPGYGGISIKNDGTLEELFRKVDKVIEEKYDKKPNFN